MCRRADSVTAASIPQLGALGTPRDGSSKQFLPEEVQELIWEFGWHLNLAVITVFSYDDDIDEQNRKVHYIWRAFRQNLPKGVDMQVYKATLGIPMGFKPWGRPRVRVHSPPSIIRDSESCDIYKKEQYDTRLGVETWAEVLRERWRWIYGYEET